jgi:hypothetical protein
MSKSSFYTTDYLKSRSRNCIFNNEGELLEENIDFTNKLLSFYTKIDLPRSNKNLSNMIFYIMKSIDITIELLQELNLYNKEIDEDNVEEDDNIFLLRDFILNDDDDDELNEEEGMRDNEIQQISEYTAERDEEILSLIQKIKDYKNYFIKNQIDTNMSNEVNFEEQDQVNNNLKKILFIIKITLKRRIEIYQQIKKKLWEEIYFNYKNLMESPCSFNVDVSMGTMVFLCILNINYVRFRLGGYKDYSQISVIDNMKELYSYGLIIPTGPIMKYNITDILSIISQFEDNSYEMSFFKSKEENNNDESFKASKQLESFIDLFECAVSRTVFTVHQKHNQAKVTKESIYLNDLNKFYEMNKELQKYYTLNEFKEYYDLFTQLKELSLETNNKIIKKLSINKSVLQEDILINTLIQKYICIKRLEDLKVGNIKNEFNYQDVHDDPTVKYYTANDFIVSFQKRPLEEKRNYLKKKIKLTEDKLNELKLLKEIEKIKNYNLKSINNNNDNNNNENKKTKDDDFKPGTIIMTAHEETRIMKDMKYMRLCITNSSDDNENKKDDTILEYTVNSRFIYLCLSFFYHFNLKIKIIRGYLSNEKKEDIQYNEKEYQSLVNWFMYKLIIPQDSEKLEEIYGQTIFRFNNNNIAIDEFYIVYSSKPESVPQKSLIKRMEKNKYQNLVKISNEKIQQFWSYPDFINEMDIWKNMKRILNSSFIQSIKKDEIFKIMNIKMNYFEVENQLKLKKIPINDKNINEQLTTNMNNNNKFPNVHSKLISYACILSIFHFNILNKFGADVSWIDEYFMFNSEISINKIYLHNRLENSKPIITMIFGNFFVIYKEDSCINCKNNIFLAIYYWLIITFKFYSGKMGDKVPIIHLFDELLQFSDYLDYNDNQILLSKTINTNRNSINVTRL